jgi:hypothetical protein
MSAYITLATPLIDQECVLAALEDVGFPAACVEIHPRPVPLVDFNGIRRPEHGELVIRRQFLGEYSNDIGFERTATGYRAHISDFDRQTYDSSWLRKLRSRYQHHDTVKQNRLAQQAALAQRSADIEAARLAEIETRRREEERRAVVEAQRQAILQKARQMNYRVQETYQGDTVRLVLVKNVY